VPAPPGQVLSVRASRTRSTICRTSRGLIQVGKLAGKLGAVLPRRQPLRMTPAVGPFSQIVWHRRLDDQPSQRDPGVSRVSLNNNGAIADRPCAVARVEDEAGPAANPTS